jgi:hypothetical protein
MTTAGAESVEFKPVGGNGKAVLRRDFFLEAFDIAVFKFHDLATACADEMVVMSLMGHVVVLGLCPKVPGLSQTRFAKQVEGPVNGGKSEMRIFAGQLVVHLLGRDVLLLQKGVEDQLTLARKFELVFPKVFFQSTHFLSMFGHSGEPILPGWELKTK